MSVRRRLEALEGRGTRPETEASEARAKAREHINACLDELAAAKREGREPSEEARAVMEAFERRVRIRGLA
jgi:hypothetical protein